MRCFKFRAWHKKDKSMIFDRSLNGIGQDFQFGDDVVLMQFTGLLDKKGVEIYEGDILQYCYIERDKRKKVNYEYLVVKWDDIYTGFPPFSEIWGYGLARFDDFYEWEVIGNIYENPEVATK